MKRVIRILSVVLLFAAVPAVVSAQDAEGGKSGKKNWREEWTLPTWNIKTNLLYDLTTTMNLGVEFRTGPKTSLDLNGNWNPWGPKNGGRKIRHYLVQPEFRWWLKETFAGHFFGLHAHYAGYNIGNLPHGPFSVNMRDNRYQGWGVGAGISYGYRWNFTRWLGLEATIGLGYAYLDYDKFDCLECGLPKGKDSRHYVGPTKVGVNLIFGFCNKRITPAAVAAVEEPVIVVYQPMFKTRFVTPEVEQIKTRAEHGQAFLDFEVNRAEIVPDFRSNAAELDKMNAIIELVDGNPDATVTGISISGYASPEGTFESNRSLSERRAQSLVDYIRGRSNFSEDIFTVSGAGEDWAGFEKLVRESDIAQKERILEIMGDESMDPDARDRSLKSLAGGVPYRTMLSEMFPLLRRSDYSINYTVVPFTVEKGKEVIETRPQDLSLNEMFLIANTYEPGSDAYNKVFETAAREFPDSDVANLNAAAIALERGEASRAAEYLGRVNEHGETYWNNMGMLRWLEGDKDAAAESFIKAGTEGNDNAVELGRHFNSLEAY